MGETIVQVTNLTVYRDSYKAVQDVSFALEDGTDTAIVGPNGAGKSTLVQAMLGILPRRQGQVQVLGQPLGRSGHLPIAVRQQVAYLPQNFLFDRRMPITVEELVGLGWSAVGLKFPWFQAQQRQAAVLSALEQVDGLYLRSRSIGQLSGGELKRMLLAYCLARPRRLLILDEAPAGLDAQNEAEFYQLLYQLKRQQGWTILQISHDLDMVRRHCDRVLCLNRTLRCQGTPEVALTPDSLAAAYTREFVRYHHHH